MKAIDVGEMKYVDPGWNYSDLNQTSNNLVTDSILLLGRCASAFSKLRKVYLEVASDRLTHRLTASCRNVKTRKGLTQILIRTFF